MGMMKIAGKKDNNTVQAIRVNSDGNQVIEHEWEFSSERVVNVTPTTTDEVRVGLDPIIPLHEYGLTSLRFQNTTGVTVHVRFMTDTVNGNTQFLTDLNGNRLEFDIPNSSTNIVYVTPDDFPVLNYLRVLSFRYKCVDTPNGTGVFNVWYSQRR